MLSPFKFVVEDCINTPVNCHAPVISSIQSEADLNAFNQFLSTQKCTVIDEIMHQAKELVKLKNPAKKLSEEDYTTLISQYFGQKPTVYWGVWCYYPWSNRMVHCLDEADFITVRTNRNKHKITDEEQQLLSTKSIGIIGLSVGQSIALTCAMERSCGTLKLADFDTIDLSNLNRLRAGIHQLNLPKAVVAAREIAEMDPYLNVEIHTEGITPNNIDSFMNGLSVLVEVCDDLPTKINSRRVARKMGIAVVMDTNDRGMIDIERYDLNRELPLFHGLVSEMQLEALPQLSASEKLGIMMQMVSFENTSERLKFSMGEIGKSITTWPQLASSIMLGAGATVDVCRRILLNEPVRSGRYYVDLYSLIG